MKLIPTSTQPVTITLYRGIPFDNNYNEHTLFSTKFRLSANNYSTAINVGHSKEDFINMKINNNYVYPRTTKSGTYNFAFGNGIVTSIVMELVDDEINSNYMKVESGSDVYYYFITGIMQKNECTYLLNLELDVIMTYTDEFLDNVANKPIMVERKHCRRIMRKYVLSVLADTYVNPICFNQESTFSKLKSNIVKSKNNLSFKNYKVTGNDYNSLMKELNWIYLIVGKSSITYSEGYEENGMIYPYTIFCFPSKPMKIEYTYLGTTETIDITPRDIMKYIGNTAIQKVIISPFPPFNVSNNLSITKVVALNSTYYKMNVSSIFVNSSQRVVFYSGTSNTGSEMLVSKTSDASQTPHFEIVSGFGGKIEYAGYANYFNATMPNISELRDAGEYKMQIAPFKDLRLSSYYGGENRVNTQFLFLKSITSGSFDIKLYTITSTNAEVNTYYDYADLGNYDVAGKKGISNSVAYTFPTGSDAETLYNQTSKSQYENSRNINAITSGLKVVGGALAIAFIPSIKAKVAGGLAIASGVTGEIQNITEWNSKMEDLQNTPNSYNFAGSSYPFDNAFANSDDNGDKSMLPYLITYGVSHYEEEMAGEFIYNYGYEFNAETYFNTLMLHGVDSVFNRQLFSYVKIREDVTSKLVGDKMPIMVAKKWNEILNAGIKFWTFFGFNMSLSTSNNDILTKYFQKTTYCNAEMITENFE